MFSLELEFEPVGRWETLQTQILNIIKHYKGASLGSGMFLGSKPLRDMQFEFANRESLERARKTITDWCIGSKALKLYGTQARILRG